MTVFSPRHLQPHDSVLALVSLCGGGCGEDTWQVGGGAVAVTSASEATGITRGAAVARARSLQAARKRVQLWGGRGVIA